MLDRRGRFAVVFASLMLASGAQAWERPARQVGLADTAPKIDGSLDDPAWAQATVIDDFTQVDPQQGSAPTERTIVRIMRDDDVLYIGVECQDLEPARIVAKAMQRDNFAPSDDRIRIAIDTFGHQSDGYYFQLTPAGAKLDALIDGAGNLNPSWNGIWLGRSRIDSHGWTAVFAIPFKTIAFDPEEETWSFNVERYVSRKQETDRWAYPFHGKRVTDLAYMGRLIGFISARQGVGLDVKPSFTIKHHHDYSTGIEKTSLSPSFDAIYNITPALTSTVTIHTDFSETEDDSRVINLTRFPLFFPEKRTFFLQDASLFTFADDSPKPFYSRRIGQAPTGEPVDLYGGAKLTGRTGPFTIGLLDVRVESSDTTPAANLAVGRLTWQAFGESRLGFMFTDGEPRGPGTNRVVGTDFNYLDSHIAEGQALSGNAWVVHTQSDLAGGNGNAFGADLKFPNDPVFASLSANSYGDRYDPALGFAPRVGVREYETDEGYVWRPSPQNRWLKSLTPEFSADVVTSFDNEVQSSGFEIPVTFAFTSGDSTSPFVSHYREVLPYAFPIASSVTIPAGDYQWNTGGVIARAASYRDVSGFAYYEAGGFYDGSSRTSAAAIVWRPSNYVSSSIYYRVTQATLPEGEFQAETYRFRLDLSASPHLTWTNLVQYDNFSEILGWFSRVRWTLEPDNDIFFVVSRRFLRDPITGDFESLTSGLAGKASWTFRF